MERDLEHIVSKWSGRIRHRERRAEFCPIALLVDLTKCRKGARITKRLPTLPDAPIWYSMSIAATPGRRMTPPTDINLLVLFSLMRRQT